MSEKYTNPVKKMIPSKLETGFQQFLYKHVGKHIPKSLTPNDVTLIGALGGLFAVVSTLLANVSPLFFIGTLLGLFSQMYHLFSLSARFWVWRSTLWQMILTDMLRAAEVCPQEQERILTL